MSELPIGIYERLLDDELSELLTLNPEVKAVLKAIDDETAPHVYSQYICQIVHSALRISKKDDQIKLVNRLISLLSATDGLEFLQRKRLLSEESNLLTQIGLSSGSIPKPITPISTSALLTGQGSDPPLEHELRSEIYSSDSVDIIVSFIKWSGLRLLIPAFEYLRGSNTPVRILTTSYMGASDPVAIEWLAKQSNIEVRVSYDTNRTRLHAKAYHFIRNTGYSTAYIGSANMSHAAMTQGLEWTVKVTNQDLPHILSRFVAEFTTYWESDEFEPFHEQAFDKFRSAINNHKKKNYAGNQFFAEITPRPFQQRILEALEASRLNGLRRNLVVAATGTGKTVISALDYKRTIQAEGTRMPLLFVVHRKEILQQALACFRSILRDNNFGELLVDGIEPTDWKHVFASVQSLNSKQPWNKFGKSHFKFVIIDEAHHGAAKSYRSLFESLEPDVLLGLTATPERMDGSSILPDFDHRFTAEIRLPEALDEKLLCPFHYFGVTDSLDLDEEKLWSNGKYIASELENLYTGDDFKANQRLDTILQALRKYLPELDGVRGIGFCAGVKHAHFMAKKFREVGLDAEVLLGETPKELRDERQKKFRDGDLQFLFAVDVLSEGVDIPEINLVMFLRPTESLTVFLQQLGRGLRHSPGKDCLTVLDFVGQTHRKYRLDTKFTALLSKNRQRIDKEIESDFPNLPTGCSIQLERIARDTILKQIKAILNDLKTFIPETIQTWETDYNLPLNFGNFLKVTGLSPNQVLSKRTWSEWKATAYNQIPPTDVDLIEGRKALSRIALRTDPKILKAVTEVSEDNISYGKFEDLSLHYLLWAKKGDKIGVSTLHDSMKKWCRNESLKSDAAEIAEWKISNTNFPITKINLPFECDLMLHASYGYAEIKAALGLATLSTPGPAGQGVIHHKSKLCYLHFVTFRKDEKDFSPTTLYQDYPISPTKLHWESQSVINQSSPTGQNYINFKNNGYTVLFFARLEKQIDGETSPFLYLGPAEDLLSFEGDRPISMVWKLAYPMPAVMFEAARTA